jgi:excisionase family DNA binding protein
MTAEDLLLEVQTLIAERRKAPQLLTVKEAALHLAVSAATVRRWIGLEKIPVVRLNGETVRIDLTDLQALVKSNKQGVNKVWRGTV